MWAAGCVGVSAAPPRGTSAAELGSPATPGSPAPSTDAPLHPVLAAYRMSLEGWLTRDEVDALAEVDMSDTLEGDPQRLRYIAADRTVRVILPLALEAQDDPELATWAAQLRALPPLLNRDTDMIALPTVRGAMRALKRVRAGLPAVSPSAVSGGPSPDALASDDPTPEEPVDSSAVPAVAAAEEADAIEEDPLELAADVDPEVQAEYVEALATYSEAYARTYGVSAAYADAAAAAASDAVDAGVLLQQVVEEYGVDRGLALGQARGILDDMASAARRRERMPRLTPRRPHQTDPMVLHGTP